MLPINSSMEPTFFPQTVVEDVVDSDFVIYGLANSFAVPQWANLSKLKTCHQCKDNLKSSHSHNCRLCGHGFCSRCTSKNHLPEKYEQKAKQGPSRVCYTCKISCIRMRQAALNLPLDSVQRMLRPPTWQDISSYIACNKCCVKRRSPHNCRLCGDLHCGDCTSKMNLNLPPAFNKKKKLGPQRVCDGCRYRIIAGARLDDGTQEQIQTFLRQQSGQQLTTGSQNDSAPASSLVLTNETGPIGSLIPTLRQHRLSIERCPATTNGGGSTPAGNIKIVYANTPTAHNTRTIIVPQPSPLALSTPRDHSVSISTPAFGTPNLNPQHAYELEQITASLNSLSLNPDRDATAGNSTDSTGGTPGRTQNGLNHIQHDIGASGVVTTMATRSQRYAAAASPLTPRTIAPASSTSGARASTQSGGTAGGVATPDRPLLDPMGEHMQLVMGSSAQPRFRPAGGRDIFRALSTVHRPQGLPGSPLNAALKTKEQTLDDQKEGDMGEGNDTLPPPPAPLASIEHAQLVKPSDLFAKLREGKK